MKFRNLACAVLAAFGMASCTAESDAIVNEMETKVSLEKTFNARSIDQSSVSKDGPSLSQLVPLTADEATTILNTLSKPKQLVDSHSVEASEGAPGQTYLTISTEKRVDSRHTLQLQLQMITYADDNSLYYKGCQSSSCSSNYLWSISGFGLSSNGTDGTYKFECASYLYFKIMEEEIKYLQVPVKVSGTYDPKSNDMSFSYSI